MFVRYLLLIFVQVLGIASVALGQLPKDALRGPQNVLPEGVIDGVVVKDEVPVRSKIEYEHVRLADYVWSKRLFSRIDSREKVNHALFYPYDEYNQEEYTHPLNRIDVDTSIFWLKNNERLSLWTIINRHILLGQLTVFDVASEKTPFNEDGYQLKYPIFKNSANDFFVNKEYREKVSRLLTFGEEGGKMSVKDANNPKDRLYLKKGYTHNTFQQWIDSLTIVGKGADVQEDDENETVYEELKYKATDPKKGPFLQQAWLAAKPGETLRDKDAVFYIDSRSIVAYNIKEDWFFDKERSMLDKRIIAIAPVANYKLPEEDPDNPPSPYEGFDRFANFLLIDRDGKLKSIEVDPDGETPPAATEFSGGGAIQKELFWLYFPELRNVMVNYYVYNTQSDAQWMTFDDFFWKRMFSATIYRATDQFDREIEDYRYGVDALYEAEKIKENMRTWETDLWNY
jgi:hypothetical protein